MLLDEFQSQVEKSKKILVTGHTGFKGTWLTLLLERLGYEVCGLSLEPEEGSLYNRINRTGVIEERILDIRSRDQVSACIKEMKPSIIFHLAAQPLVLKSYEEPVETFETNVMGTVNILDSAFRNNFVEAITVITTDKVYQNDNLGLRFKESDPLSGKDPYSASKVGTEAAVATWQQIRKATSGPHLISVRAGNVIGGGDHAQNRLLPDLIRGFVKCEEVIIRNGSSTRPWQHVLDPLSGYLLATAHKIKNDDFTSMNFAPAGESLTAAQVAHIAAQTWGAGALINIQDNNSKLEAISLQLDSSLAHEKIKWTPKWSQEEAIEATAKWWLQVHKEKVTALEACVHDMEILSK